MKIGTFTIVCGNSACNARCPCCISQMTPPAESVKDKDVNWRNFDIACQFAKECGATTALITGKGEPTLRPDLVGKYIKKAREQKFCFIELQTNGIIFKDEFGLQLAKQWYDAGLTLVCMSILHPYAVQNSQAMYPQGPVYNVWAIAEKLHEIGLSVRINLTMTTLLSEELQLPQAVLLNLKKFVDFGREYKIEQLTARPVNMPDGCDNEVARWVKTHRIEGVEKMCQDYLIGNMATPLLNLGHGATIYDWNGQNICVNNCLTESKNPEDIRQLIFLPNGRLVYSWVFSGAVIL